MVDAQQSVGMWRFGPFEVDVASRELRKSGLRIHLQGQPFHVLTVLLTRAGELVTREELRHEIWPENTFVEFDHALNTAVKKIRVALCDDACAPRYVETIPRRGYRFIAEAQPWTERPKQITSKFSFHGPGSKRLFAVRAAAGTAIALVGVLLLALSRSGHAVRDISHRNPSRWQYFPLRTGAATPGRDISPKGSPRK
jgi:DNA-binding winged helix-turn-helix (wHTH) protein